MKLNPSDETIAIVRDALGEGDFEGAVEAIFEEFPAARRDDAVDAVEQIEEEVQR